jgi:cytochrome c biogenesis protein CcdA/thiol-disulfide isomerase/thioredoxin
MPSPTAHLGDWDVLLLLGVGFLGGLITAISPCIIPVLPVIAAGGSTGGGPWRPFAIVGGLVASFTVFTLAGGELLSLLHLPQDLLRWLGITMLFVLAAGLVWPGLGDLLERPFARLGARSSDGFAGGTANGALLGVSLGVVFVPCAGPVLATISAVAATHRVGLTAVLLTLAYALGAAVPLLALAIVARRTTTGFKALRSHLPLVRRIAGVVVGLTALVLALNLTTPLTAVPGYTSSLEDHLEQSSGAESQLRALQGEHAKNDATKQTAAAGALPELGTAPQFAGITRWLNTPGDRPVSLSGLRGKVVLVDFWTYSCINCQRELPHVEAWYAEYHRYGLDVVGVHTPEFPFEYVVSNVQSAVGRLGVKFPVAIDDGYKTWDAYSNEYWPAEYLIDQNGQVRHTAFGEGEYGTTENDIRLLLEAAGAHHLPPPTDVPNRTPNQELTTETYLGSTRFTGQRYLGSAVLESRASSYTLDPDLSSGEFSFGGTWTQNAWEITAGKSAKLDLDYMADDVYLVLGGTGTVSVSVNGVHTQTVHVSGVPDLYTLVSSASWHTGQLALTASPGVKAYDFTFG